MRARDHRSTRPPAGSLTKKGDRTWSRVIAEIHVEGADQSHVFRAIMGLYLGMIALWITGAFRSDFTRPAVIAEIFFMLGLACGRGLSIIVDGVPSMFFIASAVAELALGLWGIGVLKTFSTDSRAVAYRST